jgi:glycosyltransferase involved in cell wall biosynthesis
MICAAINSDKIKESVTNILGVFPDWVKIVPPRNDIASYFKMADIFLSPSREEGFCNSLIEAAYLKKVIVASDCKGQKRGNEVPNVFWFRNGDLEDFIAKLAEAVEKNLLYIKELEETKKAVIKKYDMTTWADSIVEIYNANPTTS